MALPFAYQLKPDLIAKAGLRFALNPRLHAIVQGYHCTHHAGGLFLSTEKYSPLPFQSRDLAVAQLQFPNDFVDQFSGFIECGHSLPGLIPVGEVRPSELNDALFQTAQLTLGHLQRQADETAMLADKRLPDAASDRAFVTVGPRVVAIVPKPSDCVVAGELIAALFGPGNMAAPDAIPKAIAIGHAEVVKVALVIPETVKADGVRHIIEATKSLQRSWSRASRAVIVIQVLS